MIIKSAKRSSTHIEDALSVLKYRAPPRTAKINIKILKPLCEKPAAKKNKAAAASSQ